MRILLLTHAFNSLTQRLFVELRAQGHEVSVEFDINDQVTREAVALFRPHLILAPYLRRAIPESVWRGHLCLVVHPGPVGDRGPSALDWAIRDGEQQWGLTLLQAEAEMDSGPVWASATFPLRPATKSSLYRNEVTEAAVAAVLETLARLPDYQTGRWRPQAQAPSPLRPLMRQSDRAIDWARDTTATVLAKVRSGDGFPGVRDTLFGAPCHLYDAPAFPAEGGAGEVLGRAGEGLVRATVDGALWIGRARRLADDLPIKLPMAHAFPEVADLPQLAPGEALHGGVRYEEAGPVGYLHFGSYNGAMGTRACEELLSAFVAARRRPTRVLVLLGGEDFFSNGLDLNRIEAAASPADESWRNINAMDDLCRAILTTDTQVTVSALRGNAGAGGAFLALAADLVWARRGVILNPHYKNMGNLYGSEYWTYLLPRRLGEAQAAGLMARRLPLGAAEAERIGLLDACFGDGLAGFEAEVRARAAALAVAEDHPHRLAAKAERRVRDEAIRPLDTYRAEELRHMQRNFFGFDPSYHVARHHFVHKTPHSWTPRHLAIHSELGWVVPAD